MNDCEADHVKRKSHMDILLEVEFEAEDEAQALIIAHDLLSMFYGEPPEIEQ